MNYSNFHCTWAWPFRFGITCYKWKLISIKINNCELWKFIKSIMLNGGHMPHWSSFFLSDFVFSLFCERHFSLMTGIVCHVSNDMPQTFDWPLQSNYSAGKTFHLQQQQPQHNRFCFSLWLHLADESEPYREINQIKFKASIVLILCDVRRVERIEKKGNIIVREKKTRNTLTYIRRETKLNNHLRLLNRKYTVLIEKFYK